MTRRRWIADEVAGDRAVLVGTHALHLTRVLRARIGQEFDISADGSVRRGRIVKLDNNRVEFELGEELHHTSEPEVTLVLAVFKFDRMEWAIEKCTELGIARIIPMVARRTEVHLASAAQKRVERWKRLALQASEQSRRTAPPEITSPVKLSGDVLQMDGSRIVLAESQEQVTLAQAIDSDPGWKKLALAVGPEGGWTEDELRLFADSGWIEASLGERILRAETAAIAALAIAMSAFN